MGLPPHTLLGDIVPKPLLRFALMGRYFTIRKEYPPDYKFSF